MKRKLNIILICLLSSLVILVVLNFIIKEFDIVTYLTGISSFIIAILTVFYVLTNSNQLDVMSKQLVEMKKDRELQNQPLPWIENVRFKIDAPRLFYSPPDKKHSFISRYSGYIDLINLSDCPAISIDITSKLIIKNREEETVLESIFERVDTLAGNKRYPRNESDKKISFLFSSDETGKLFSILRDFSKTPILKVDIVYRNILGGCFLIENEYQLIQHKEDDDMINLWHTDIVSFETKEKEILEKLIHLKKQKDSGWDELFDSVTASYKYEKDKVALNAYSLKGALKINTLETEDYEKRLEGKFYGHRLKHMTKENKTPSA